MKVGLCHAISDRFYPSLILSQIPHSSQNQCSNCRGVWGVEHPTSSCRPPYLWLKFDPGGVEAQPPHLSFAEVGMLLDSHFLLMQFLKYDDLNVTTILIHIEDKVVPSRIVR